MVESDRNFEFGGNLFGDNSYSHGLLDMNDKEVIKKLG